ncbi:MAG: HD domain-containing protein [Lactobacillus sp.]|jgi:hypothetical protein|nr:HD domain-containing protein [Lactobacillus sp.]
MITRKEAEAIIDDVKKDAIKNGRRESTWFRFHNHIYGTAAIAELMAAKAGMDAERAYVLGLLHDVMKLEEYKAMRFHGILGYERLKDVDEGVARICLTHMFPFNVFENAPPSGSQMFFGDKEDVAFVKSFLKDNEPDDYDLLIQIADCFADSRGFVTLQQRGEDYALRYGMEFPPELMKPRFDLKEFFDKRIGGNTYDLFYNPKVDGLGIMGF